jgi:type 1 fimbria pilin
VHESDQPARAIGQKKPWYLSNRYDLAIDYYRRFNKQQNVTVGNVGTRATFTLIYSKHSAVPWRRGKARIFQTKKYK